MGSIITALRTAASASKSCGGTRPSTMGAVSTCCTRENRIFSTGHPSKRPRPEDARSSGRYEAKTRATTESALHDLDLQGRRDVREELHGDLEGAEMLDRLREVHLLAVEG